MASRTEANGSNRLVHFLDLNDYGLRDVPADTKNLAKREVADFLLNEVLRSVDAGTSPVKGEGRFRILDPEYAKKEKGGRRTSNLELEGDLKDSLVSRPGATSFVEFGHYGAQVPKSDGHNQISGKAISWAKDIGFPRRRYIPDDGQKFDTSITTGISNIIEEFKVNEVIEIDAEEDLADEDILAGINDQARSATTVNVSRNENNLFSDDVIDDLLEDAFSRRQF